jgi:hypothetical protein
VQRRRIPSDATQTLKLSNQKNALTIQTQSNEEIIQKVREKGKKKPV